MEEKVMLSEVIQKCKEFDKGETKKEVLDELGSRITIRAYLPIVDKMEILYDFYFSKSSLFPSIEGQMIEFEVKKFWKILLKYTNIEIDDEKLCSLENYDLCFPMIHDYIAQFCYPDYRRTCEMVSNYTTMMYVKMIASYFEEMDTDNLEESNKETRELLKNIAENKELIFELNNLLIFNDPSTKKMIENLKKEALENSKNK